MTIAPLHKHLSHFFRHGGTCHITWRLQRGQRPLLPDDRDIVMSVLRQDADRTAQIIAAVVMHDHVHVLAKPIRRSSGARLAQKWKNATSHAILRASDRTAPLWQAEDELRWMNSSWQTQICSSYIRNNPSRRWPGTANYPWLI